LREADKRATDLPSDLVLEPGGLLPQRLHGQAGGRAARSGTRDETANRSRGGDEPTRTWVRQSPALSLFPAVFFLGSFAWIASFARLPGALAVVGGFPHGPFSQAASQAAVMEPRARSVAPSVGNNKNGSGCQAGPAGRFVRASRQRDSGSGTAGRCGLRAAGSVAVWERTTTDESVAGCSIKHPSFIGAPAPRNRGGTIIIYSRRLDGTDAPIWPRRTNLPMPHAAPGSYPLDPRALSVLLPRPPAR
jgi:hypothetical protein